MDWEDMLDALLEIAYENPDILRRAQAEELGGLIRKEVGYLEEDANG